MSKPDLDVAIIGPGPYGLSIASHLGAAGVEHRVFGRTMDSWQNHMPPGMCLKSFGNSSSLFDPSSSFTLEHFCRESGIEYHPSRVPVKLETFVAYGKAFQERFVPRVEPKLLVSLTPTRDAHVLVFDDAEKITARRVVLATGVVHYRYMPADLLARLPPSLVSHSGDYGPLTGLAGKTVTVLGHGSSAVDIAALLGLRGNEVTLVCRAPRVDFQAVPPSGPPPSLVRRAYRSLLRPPARGLGAGWVLAACASAPQLIHALPDRVRASIVNTYLGPLGGYSIREAFERHVTRRLGRTIEGAEERNGRVRLTTRDHNGTREVIESDHLIAATGYRVDLRRLSFLGNEALRRLRAIDQVPVLSGDFEASVPGLYFVGLTSARAFGPVMRFVEGALFPAERLARVFARSAARRRGKPAPASEHDRLRA